jgi:hypothetical protein
MNVELYEKNFVGVRFVAWILVRFFACKSLIMGRDTQMHHVVNEICFEQV